MLLYTNRKRIIERREDNCHTEGIKIDKSRINNIFRVNHAVELKQFLSKLSYSNNFQATTLILLASMFNV